MIGYDELDQAITVFTQDDVHKAIPIECYQKVIELAVMMNNDGKHWDIHQFAAILLYLTVSEGHIQSSQLTGSALIALDYAEKLIVDNGLSTGQVGKTGKISFKLIS